MTLPRESDQLDYPQDVIDEAHGMLGCPWYQGTGICVSGCQTEPACQTCEPLEGWAAIAALAPHSQEAEHDLEVYGLKPLPNGCLKCIGCGVILPKSRDWNQCSECDTRDYEDYC